MRNSLALNASFSANTKRRAFSLRVLLGMFAVLCLFAVILVPIIRQVHQSRHFYGHVGHVAETIHSFHSRCPQDVPVEQWREAVDWTENVIHQDFFSPNPRELPGLETLSQELDERVKGEVDLVTLQWIWDKCADACGGPDSYGIRFRNVQLLTKGAITDANLPEVWSLSRCTGLGLSGTQITDASIPYLSQLTQLERLDIRSTQITEGGAEQLRRALPTCHVFH